MTGRLIIISSPSGGGKGSLIKEVRSMLPDLGYSVSHTTRPQRFGEEDGREYFFTTKQDFERRIAGGDFLEYANVHGNLYGTSLRESQKVFNTGRDLIVEVDVQGAIQISEKLPESITIFILPPSFEVLKARLTARGTEGEGELRTRLRNAFNEVLEYEKFKYVIVNQDLGTAARQIASIINAERQRLDRQSDAIRDILDSFDTSKAEFQGE
ncbi:MAG: guanylate kinase [Pyrinomonadaceae bacterium]|nr:guanylate kinase [Acidobacteriota bacterium]MBK7934297.1 guanylate kinase [Acidobacteriota bacterium]MBP7376743.1 guanylate kinase [Pyrinomonadaceae bacterium]